MKYRQALSSLAMLHTSCERLSLRKSGTWVPSCPALWKRSWSAITGKCSGPGTISGAKRKKTEFRAVRHRQLSDVLRPGPGGGAGHHGIAVARHRRTARSWMCTALRKHAEIRGSYGQSRQDQDALEAAEVQPPVKKDRKPLYLCHGDLDQHHVLMGGSYTAIIEYNRMHLGIQISDLYRFMRKVMEKHGWNLDLGLSMLDSYEAGAAHGADVKRTCLYYLFLYPGKYWKQLNFTGPPTRPGYRPGILTNCGAWRNSSRPGTAF
ncbi:MAG: hypothetical protein ACLTW9_16365 [Enterocloster sp.]